MTAENVSKISNQKVLWLFVLTAIGFTLFLGYIDEGYYNFNWMNDAGNWMALFIYMLFILVGQFAFYFFFFGRRSFSGKLLLSILMGAGLGILFAVGLFSIA